MGEGLIGETKEERQRRLAEAQERLKKCAPFLAGIYALLHDGEALDVNLDESRSGILNGREKKPIRKLIIFRPSIHYTLTVKTGAITL